MARTRLPNSADTSFNEQKSGVILKSKTKYFQDAIFHQKSKIYDVLSLLYLLVGQTTRSLHEILTRLFITENAFSGVFSNKQPGQYFM